jgi:hypothetical protein
MICIILTHIIINTHNRIGIVYRHITLSDLGLSENDVILDQMLIASRPQVEVAS